MYAEVNSVNFYQVTYTQIYETLHLCNQPLIKHLNVKLQDYFNNTSYIYQCEGTKPSLKFNTWPQCA